MLVQASFACLSTEFECKNEKCVSISHRCDGDNDCRDDSDELDCPSCHSTRAFHCNNSKCVPTSFECDGWDDCGDYSDEIACNETCTVGDFKCHNDLCVPAEYRCDGDNDCGDFSDELLCRDYNCTGDRFRCDNFHCIPNSWVCDGENDCFDFSDETRNCSSPALCYFEFNCGNGRCVPNSYRCDDFDDCGNDADERNCDQSTVSTDSDKSTAGTPEKKIDDSGSSGLSAGGVVGVAFGVAIVFFIAMSAVVIVLGMKIMRSRVPSAGQVESGRDYDKLDYAKDKDDAELIQKL